VILVSRGGDPLPTPRNTVLPEKLTGSQLVISIFFMSVNTKVYVIPTVVRNRTAYSVELLATGWTVRGSNPGADYLFRTAP